MLIPCDNCFYGYEDIYGGIHCINSKSPYDIDWDECEQYTPLFEKEKQ